MMVWTLLTALCQSCATTCLYCTTDAELWCSAATMTTITTTSTTSSASSQATRRPLPRCSRDPRAGRGQFLPSRRPPRRHRLGCARRRRPGRRTLRHHRLLRRIVAFPRGQHPRRRSARAHVAGGRIIGPGRDPVSAVDDQLGELGGGPRPFLGNDRDCEGHSLRERRRHMRIDALQRNRRLALLLERKLRQRVGLVWQPAGEQLVGHHAE